MTASVSTLAEYYRRLGFPEDAWHVGPEHPGLEELALKTLESLPRARILEVGVQSGGFTAPVVLACAGRQGFSYVGIDNLEYTNAVPLRVIEDYLREQGVRDDIRFIEDDSTVALASLNAQFDLILLDHYKPKYPLDLLDICKRDLLATDGIIILHDVLTHAAPDWKVCVLVCRAFGYEWTVDATVSQGAALVRRSTTARRRAALIAIATVRVVVRWWLHAAVLRTRRRIGRALRVLGLRS